MFAAGAVLVAASTLCAVSNYQKIPQFYTSTDCTGPIDAESKLWGFAAEDGGQVMPFAVEGAYMQGWAFENCLDNGDLNYSVKIAVNGTACADDNAANQVVLEYFGSSSGCSGVPTEVVPLTANECVRYARGSVRLTLKLNLTDMCILTEYVSKMHAGGLEFGVWRGAGCEGSEITIELGIEKRCSQEPECVGCCRNFEEDQRTSTCRADGYRRSKTACRRRGSTWDFAFIAQEYNDAACAQEKNYFLNDVVFLSQKCVAVTYEGRQLSSEVRFTPPMTIDVMCNFVEMTLRNNIASDMVSWDQVPNAGVAAVPHVTALVLAVVVAVLL